VDIFDVLVGLSNSDRFLKEDFRKQPFAQQVFTTIWSLQTEVENGGFLQYLHNSSNETACSAVSSLKAIGAELTANIFEEVIKEAFPNGLSESSFRAGDEAANFSEKTCANLQLLTYDFLQCPEDLIERLYGFVISHPEEFGAPPYPCETDSTLADLADQLNAELGASADKNFRWHNQEKQ
jgi:hypothetical protein